MGDNNSNNFDDYLKDQESLRNEEPLNKEDLTQEDTADHNQDAFEKEDSFQNQDNTAFQESNMGTVNSSTDSMDNFLGAMDYTKPGSSDSFEQSFETGSVTGSKGRKPSGKLVAIFILLAVVVIGSAAAYLNRSALSNTYALMTKSPLEYYTYTETQSINKGIDTYTSYYDKSLTEYKALKDAGVAEDVNLKLTVSPQFTSLIGLTDFESLEAQIHSQAKGMNSGKYSVGLSYNGQSLATLNSFINNETSEIFLQVPELSSAYLLFSMDEMMQSYDTDIYGGSYSNYMQKVESLINSDTLSPDVINTLLKKYSSLIIQNIDDVKMEKNAKVTASDINSSYTKLIATLNGEDVYNMGMAILNEAKTDDSLKAIVVELGYSTEEEYASAIDSAIQELTAEKETMTAEEESVVMNVYVDNTGRIMGREFVSNEEGIANKFGYYITNKGSQVGFRVFVSEDETDILDISGKGTYSSAGFNGTATLNYSEYSDAYGDYTTYSFDVAIENAKLDKENNYINGKFTLTSDSLMGAEVSLNCTGDESQQEYLFTVLYGNLEAATLDIVGKKGTYEEFQYPSSSDEVYDGITDISSYMSTMDVEGFTSKIQSITGIDFNSLLSSYLYGGLY